MNYERPYLTEGSARGRGRAARRRRVLVEEIKPKFRKARPCPWPNTFKLRSTKMGLTVGELLLKLPTSLPRLRSGHSRHAMHVSFGPLDVYFPTPSDGHFWFAHDLADLVGVEYNADAAEQLRAMLTESKAASGVDIDQEADSVLVNTKDAGTMAVVLESLWTHHRHLAACYHRLVDHVARRLEDALELADLAERMVRARLQREQPSLRGNALEARVRAWLRSRPCAVDGDADGRPVDLEQPT